MLKAFCILALSFTITPALAEEGKPSEKDLKKNACYDDVQKYCSEFSKSPRRTILQCLKQNEAKLSKGCKKLRNANKPKIDNSPEAQALRANLQQMVTKSCGEYMKKYCSGPDLVLPGPRLACLSKQNDLPKDCTDTIATVKKMIVEARKAKK
jgi:hypothetical protein